MHINPRPGDIHGGHYGHRYTLGEGARCPMTDLCRRCHGSGREDPDRSSNEAMGIILLVAFYGCCMLVIGLGVGYWCRCGT